MNNGQNIITRKVGAMKINVSFPQPIFSNILYCLIPRQESYAQIGMELRFAKAMNTSEKETVK